jgi:hypothetical protein
MPSKGVRYTPFLTPDRQRWVIFDWWLYGYCTLPDGNGNLLPLEWKTSAGAEAWLFRCRQLWGAGSVPAPDGWERKPEPIETSPWDRGIQFYS